MALESVTHISDLNASNPVGATDPKSEGDDHIRNIKTALKTDFPNVDGACNPTPAEFNILDGVTATTAEINQLDESARTVANFTSGVVHHFVDDGIMGTSFDVDANVTQTTSETIGPTGSGADHIWTAMDAVPLTAKAIIVRGFIGITDAATGTENSLLGAVRGDTVASTAVTHQIGRILAYIGASGIIEGAMIPESTIPIHTDGTIAVMYTSSTLHASNQCTLYTKGWVE